MLPIRKSPTLIALISLLGLLVILTAPPEADAHGRLWRPWARTSLFRWGQRSDCTRPKKDDEGKETDDNISCRTTPSPPEECGFCGNPVWENPPLACDTTAKSYSAGQRFTVKVDIVVNHGGTYQITLCTEADPNDANACPIANRHVLEDKSGEDTFVVNTAKIYRHRMQLPAGVTCSHCILQWKWVGTATVGDLEYYGCSDIVIS